MRIIVRIVADQCEFKKLRGMYGDVASNIKIVNVADGDWMVARRDKVESRGV